MKLKLHVYLLVLSFIGISLHSFAQDSVLIYSQKAREAYQSDNLKDFLSYTKKCNDIIPQNTYFLYNLACAYSLNSQQNEAIYTLTKLVENGAIYNISVEPDFKNIKETEEFKKLENIRESNFTHINNSKIAFELQEKDLIPEGITYDPVNKTFLIGSIYKCKIVSVNSDNNVTDFVSNKDLMPFLGMEVDAKRRILWATNCYGYIQDKIPEDSLGIARIYKINADDGSIIKRYELPKSENHFMNDVTITNDGSVFITDSHVPAIYEINSKKNIIEKFVDLPTGSYPNGITMNPDQSKLFVATSFNIYSVDLKSKTVSSLSYPENILYSGCDGLYFYKNSLIGVQGGLGRIIQYHLNEDLTKVIDQTILEAHNPSFNSPTTGVIVDNTFYLIANAQFNGIDEQGKLIPLSELNTTKILAIDIPDKK